MNPPPDATTIICRRSGKSSAITRWTRSSGLSNPWKNRKYSNFFRPRWGKCRKIIIPLINTGLKAYNQSFIHSFPLLLSTFLVLLHVSISQTLFQESPRFRLVAAVCFLIMIQSLLPTARKKMRSTSLKEKHSFPECGTFPENCAFP